MSGAKKMVDVKDKIGPEAPGIVPEKAIPRRLVAAGTKIVQIG